MVDAIQSRSSIPRPLAQTELGSQNRAAIDSPKDSRSEDASASEKRTASSADRFEDYLNQTSITTLEKADRTTAFDPAAEITANSVYAQPGGSIA